MQLSKSWRVVFPVFSMLVSLISFVSITSQTAIADDAPLSSRDTAGPGIPAINFPRGDVNRILSQNDTRQAIGAVIMHDGYLIVPMSADAGGGRGRAALHGYDISDPASPRLVFNSRDFPDRYHNAGARDYIGNWGEAHQMAMSGNRLLVREIDNDIAWVSMFDLTGFPERLPRTLGRVRFTGTDGVNGYNGSSFSPALLGDRYVYAPTGNQSLYILDFQDPSNPRTVNIIPRSELGRSSKQSAAVLGNWLILSPATPRASGDVVIFDITDPVNPVAIGSFDASMGYQGWVCGSLFFTGRDGPLEAYDFADPGNIVRRVFNNNAGDTFDRSEYGFCQDNNVFVGHYPGLTKWNLSARGAPLVAHARPTNPSTDDYAFITPLGNMAVIASDHNNPNRFSLAVHQAGADRTAPAVDFIVPNDGSVNNNVRTKIGISFTDFPDALSLGTDTIRIQPLSSTGQPGNAVEGSFSQQFGIVNFLPDRNLQRNTTYRVTLTAGGVRDWAGNAIARDTVISTFSTGSAIAEEITPPSLAAVQPVLIDERATFSVNDNGANATYAWDFGDGTPETRFSSNTRINHTYDEPGNYLVTLIVRLGNEEYREFTQVVVSAPLPDILPTQSSSIVFDGRLQRVFNVNPDNNTVTATDAVRNRKLFETSVGQNPQSVAVTPDNRIWVVNRDDANVTELNATSGAVTRTVDLPNGSAPHSVVIDARENVAYISLQQPARILKLSIASGRITDQLNVDSWPRHMALDGQNNRLLVGHFISTDDAAQVSVIDLANFSVVREINLGHSTEADDSDNGRGLPNYLGAFALSPDLTQAMVPSKKDNIRRGGRSDGNALTFEHTVRSMAAQIDLNTLSEITANRIDFDNNDFATSLTYSPLGNRVYVTTSGSSTVWSVDAYRPENKVSFPSGGSAPRGITTNSDGSKLFVHNFLSREVAVFNVSGNTFTRAATIDVVQTETLASDVLRGKQLFYVADDTRLNQEGYMSCASCHLDGSHDGRTWDFSNFGEGMRNTIDLRGRAGTRHGRLHWTANFDEVQDFENQIRSLNLGTGLLSDRQFTQTESTLGVHKAGLSAELDALDAYLASLETVGTSPFRRGNGSLTSAGVNGQRIFQEQGCNTCHDGDIFTDSPTGTLHDIGTRTQLSGNRLGGNLPGFDTPSLKGVWRTAPYLHDGSAATLADAITAHSNVDISRSDLNRLVSYVNQIDDNEAQQCLAAGQSCNDARSSTLNDVIQADCSCRGDTVASSDVPGGSSGSDNIDLSRGRFSIAASHSGLYLGTRNNSTENGESLIQTTDSAVAWEFEPLGGDRYLIVNPQTNRAVDVLFSNTDRGGDIVQWNIHGRANQQFAITEVNQGQYQIRNVNSNMCLDVEVRSVDSGANVQQWSCAGVPNQIWNIRALDSSPAPAGRVVFYQDHNFVGASWAIGPGTYNFQSINSSPVGNDAISSIQIPNGFTVEYCEHGNGGGDCFTTTADHPNLSVFNDRISYIRITER